MGRLRARPIVRKNGGLKPSPFRGIKSNGGKKVSGIKSVKKRRKKTTLRKLKEQLEALQKQVVIKIYGTLCYTHRPIPKDTKTKQLGHMPWARAELSQTCIYDYHFTRIQCGQCNGFGQGMSMTARERMTAEGIDLDEMWGLNLATKGKPHTKQFYLDKIDEYTHILELSTPPSIHT